MNHMCKDCINRFVTSVKGLKTCIECDASSRYQNTEHIFYQRKGYVDYIKLWLKEKDSERQNT